MLAIDCSHQNTVEGSIEYIKFDGKIGSYYPDFFVKLNNKEKWIIETKGAESLNDPRKFARLKEF